MSEAISGIGLAAENPGYRFAHPGYAITWMWFTSAAGSGRSRCARLRIRLVRARRAAETATAAGLFLIVMLIPFPIACFVLTFVSDLAFYKTSNEFWATASLWLLGIGLIMAALAAAMGLIDVFGDDRIRNLSDAWLHAGGNVRC